MMNIILFVFTIVSLYTLNAIVESVIDIKIKYNKNKICVFAIFTLILFVNRIYCIEYLKIISATLIMYFYLNSVIKTKFSKKMFIVIYFQIISIFYELILLSLFMNILAGDLNKLLNNNLFIFVFNSCIYLLIYVTSKMILIKKLIKFLNSFALEIRRDYKLFFTFSVMLLFNILIVNIYLPITYSTYIVLNILMMLSVTIILYRIIVEKNKNAIMEIDKKVMLSENKALIDSLNQYEEVADKHRRDSHENNNQLSSIYLMLQTDSDTKEIMDYIKSLQGSDKLADISNLKRTKRIPSGGLQGIIYQKIIYMDNKGIKNILNVSRDMKSFDFNKLNMDLMTEACKILGVFLDNAIEEVLTIKDKIVVINLYKSGNNFCISVKNTYQKGKDFDNINDRGYSTKGSNRGYGLSLVEELVNNNKRLIHETEVTDKYFKQTIKIKNMLKKR